MFSIVWQPLKYPTYKSSVKFCRYADLLVTLMAQDCRYFLLTYLFDEERFPGPPHPFSFNAVNELFRKYISCKVFLNYCTRCKKMF